MRNVKQQITLIRYQFHWLQLFQQTHLQISKPIPSHHSHTRLHSSFTWILINCLYGAESTHEAEPKDHLEHAHVLHITLTLGTASTRGKKNIWNMLQDIQANRGVMTPAITNLSGRNANKMHRNILSLTHMPYHILWCHSHASLMTKYKQTHNVMRSHCIESS